MKVLLIDDHPLILAALQAMIEGLGEGNDVVGAGSAADARRTLREQPDFDLVLLDLGLDDADGFDVLAEFRAQYPGIPVVVVSASDRAADVIRAIDMGAMGFVPKRSPNDMLHSALRQVMSGGIFVPPMRLGSDAMAPRAPGEGLADGEAAARAGNALAQAPSLASLGLTPRQMDVLALLLQAKPNKMIARELNLSVETIKDHVAAVLRSLGVATRTQAVLAVSQMSAQRQSEFMAWKPTPRK